MAESYSRPRVIVQRGCHRGAANLRKSHGKKADGELTWENVLSRYFAALRTANLKNPWMDGMENVFATGSY